MSIEFWKPEEIEAESFRRISEELGDGQFPAGVDLVVKRVIHTTADFSFADTLLFSEGVVEQGKEAIRQGACIVTDTNMALAGINKARLAGFGATARCFMAEADVAAEAKERGVTRATVSMERAAELSAERPLILAIGNAPTALVKIKELMDAGQMKPALLIAAPVGFVNVVEAKELFVGSSTPHIIARGRKGGSTVAAAIVNAILYQI